MFKYLRHLKVKSTERKNMREAVNSLVEESSITKKFVIFTIISTIMAAMGIGTNNVPVLIGAMLIAPLLNPVIGMSVGVGAGSLRLTLDSVLALLVGTLLALISAATVTLLFQGMPDLDTLDNFYQRMDNGYSYALVAFLSGIVGVYSWLRPKTDQVVPGVAIAVALIPPMAFFGAAFTVEGAEHYLMDTFHIILINLVGIFLGGLITFILFAVFSRRPTEEVEAQVDQEVKKKKRL